MRRCAHLWLYLPELFLSRNPFQIKVVEKTKIHCMFNFLSKILLFMRQCRKIW